jgi:hypothetical protein
MAEITIADLILNGTMSAEIAAVLWAAVDEQVSFLTVAVPRFAGKSTTSRAILALRPPAVPVHSVAGEAAALERLRLGPGRGYLVVNEFSRAPVPGYIWGAPVRRVFDLLPAGYALQACLHAPGPEAAIREVTEGNGVSDELASAIKLVLYLERFGADEATFWRRLVEVYEVHRIEGGRAVGNPLFKWLPAEDRFEQFARPAQFGRDAAELQQRAAVLTELVRAGTTTSADLERAVAAYPAQR